MHSSSRLVMRATGSATPRISHPMFDRRLRISPSFSASPVIIDRSESPGTAASPTHRAARETGSTTAKQLYHSTTSEQHQTPVPQYDMQVVTHHGKGQHINPEHSGEKLQTVLNELLAVIKALPRDLVRPTQKRPPDTPIDAVVNPHLIIIHHKLTRHTRHACPVATLDFTSPVFTNSAIRLPNDRSPYTIPDQLTMGGPLCLPDPPYLPP